MNVASLIRLGFDELTPGQMKTLERSLTFVNGNQEVVISYRKLVGRGYYVLPRGAWYLMPDTIRYNDLRTKPLAPKLKFTVKLDDTSKDPRYEGQSACIETMFEQQQGLIIRAPGTGKTQIALAFAARCETPVLVIVHTKDILDQWVQYTERAIPELKGKVGVIAGNTVRIGQITIAMVRTLNNMVGKKSREWWSQWGCVIVDEAHHTSAESWENVINTLPAHYRFGFTASKTRADRMHPTMRFIIGPIIHEQKFSSSVDLEVERVKTDFWFQWRGSFDWQRLLNDLIADEERNMLIAQRVEEEYAKGNFCLVLSRRIDHLHNIAQHLSSPYEILTGERTAEDRRKLLKRFRDGKFGILLATQLADEALDIQRLNRVFLTFPGKHEGRIIQQIGRAIRQHPEKEDALILDYVDKKVRVLYRQAQQRKATYIKEKITIRSKGRLKWRR